MNLCHFRLNDFMTIVELRHAIDYTSNNISDSSSISLLPLSHVNFFRRSQNFTLCSEFRLLNWKLNEIINLNKKTTLLPQASSKTVLKYFMIYQHQGLN